MAIKNRAQLQALARMLTDTADAHSFIVVISDEEFLVYSSLDLEEQRDLVKETLPGLYDGTEGDRTFVVPDFDGGMMQ